MDEGSELHWLPPRVTQQGREVPTECYLILKDGTRVDYLVHQKVPYLAGEELTELALSLVQNEEMANEFFEDLIQLV